MSFGLEGCQQFIGFVGVIAELVRHIATGLNVNVDKGGKKESLT